MRTQWCEIDSPLYACVFLKKTLSAEIGQLESPASGTPICTTCPAQQPLRGTIDHQEEVNAQSHQGFKHSSIMNNHQRTPRRCDALCIAGIPVFNEQLESALGLCVLPFPCGEVRMQCVSSGCPLLRCPFIPVTKTGLEIGHRQSRQQTCVTCNCDLACGFGWPSKASVAPKNKRHVKHR